MESEKPGAFGLATQIRANHIKSALLMAGFPLLFIAVLWFFGALGFFQGGTRQCVATPYGISCASASAPQPYHPLDMGMEAVVRFGPYAFGAAGLWFVIAYFCQGALMRMATGSRPVTRAEYPKIYNLLENLCISRGLPMPQFEIIDSAALNAFATGISEKDFKIVLTRGIVETLNDEELESVIGHELTHIINRDVRLLVVSVIFVGIFSFLLQLVFRGMINGLFSTRREGNKSGGFFAMLIVLGVLGLAYLLALVIRFAISRRREFLADAGSIELTKNPEAMMRALRRIAGHDHIEKMPGEARQMCIENAPGFFSLFSTHPPIEARIRAISEMTDTKEAAAGPWG